MRLAPRHRNVLIAATVLIALVLAYFTLPAFRAVVDDFVYEYVFWAVYLFSEFYRDLREAIWPFL